MTQQHNRLTASQSPIRLVIHGGAGAISRARLTKEHEQAYHQQLREALLAGYAVLNAGRSSIEAVTEAIVVMEDSPLFNAGKGSVFTHEGHNELDAAIMDGANRMAGAVAGVRTIRNPIRAAQAVMTQSSHVMLIAEGAEAFARDQGLEIVDPTYFYTQQRWEQLQRVIERERAQHHQVIEADSLLVEKDGKYGTVGAVALDCNGNLAAGTSTGGLANKRYGRVGDSPIIGAGTYADNRSVAVSGTGTGEMFIRTAAAYSIAARVQLRQVSITEAADQTLADIAAIGGGGGVIVLDKEGRYAMRFITSGMYRGTIGGDGVPWVGIFPEAEIALNAEK